MLFLLVCSIDTIVVSDSNDNDDDEEEEEEEEKEETTMQKPIAARKQTTHSAIPRTIIITITIIIRQRSVERFHLYNFISPIW